MIRGVPLISLLFMASVMFPLFLPDGMNIDKLLRAQVAIILFAGAYLAEVVRAVSQWQTVALSPAVGLQAKEVNDFAPAFEHEQKAAAHSILNR